MSDLNNYSVDDEMGKYIDAFEIKQANINMQSFPHSRRRYNPNTNRNDVLAQMENGGYIKVGDEPVVPFQDAPQNALARVQENQPVLPFQDSSANALERVSEPMLPFQDAPANMVAKLETAAPEQPMMQENTDQSMDTPGASIESAIEYADTVKRKAGNVTADDMLAAGYDENTIKAIGIGAEVEPMVLSTQEIEDKLRNGGSLLEYDPTIRETGRVELTQYLMELAEDSLAEDLRAQGIRALNPEADTNATLTEDQIATLIEGERPRLENEARSLSGMFFGSPNSLGIGVGDFVTAGVMDIQEGARLFTQGRTTGGLDRSMGALLVLAGIAEATGVGMFIGKAIKKSIPAFRAGLSNVGERLNQPGEMPTVGSNLGNVGDVAKVEAPTENKPGIIAFHGSGADFNEFKLEEIGTGEGAQAFGYGLYFTDSEDIAKFYKNSLARSVDIDGKPYIRGNKIYEDLVDPDIRDDLGATSGDLEKSIEDAEKYLQEYIEDNNVEAIKSTANEVKKLKKLRGRVTVNSNSDAKTYKVALAPKPDELIDYDLPLKEQPQILEKLQNVTEIITMNERGTSYDNLTGKELLRLLEDNKAVSSLGKPKSVAEQLNNVGISGIKYKANRGIGNRVSSSKTKNYVIFDDRLISILKKYGIAAPVAVSSMAVKSSDQEDET